MILRSVSISLASLTLLAGMAIGPYAFVPRVQAAGLENTGGTAGLENTGGTKGATTDTSSSGTSLVNPLRNITDLPTLLTAVLKALVKIGTVILILAFIWIGFLFVRAQGNPEQLKKARAAFLWTIIGGLILLGAESISTVIQSTVGKL